MISRKLLCSMFVAALAIGVTNSPAEAKQKTNQISFGNLISALNNVSVILDNVDIIDDVTVGDITVVDARNLLQGARINALNNALNNNNVEILNLRDVLNDNEIIKDVLNDADIDIDDVIGVDVLNGRFVIFTLVNNVVD